VRGGAAERKKEDGENSVQTYHRRCEEGFSGVISRSA